MAYEVGDPGHVPAHNELRDTIQEWATALGISVDLPGDAVVGQSGHVTDHNLLSKAMEVLAENANPGPAAAKAAVLRAAGSQGTIINEDVAWSGGEPGSTYDIYRWESAGLIQVTTEGIAHVFMVGGGAGGSTTGQCGVQGSNTAAGGGDGGAIYQGVVFLPVGSHVVLVGNGGGTNGRGTFSQIVWEDGTYALTAKGGQNNGGLSSRGGMGAAADTTGKSGGAGYGTTLGDGTTEVRWGGGGGAGSGYSAGPGSGVDGGGGGGAGTGGGGGVAGVRGGGGGGSAWRFCDQGNGGKGGGNGIVYVAVERQ